MQLRNVASLLAVQVAAWSGELEAPKMLATARAIFDFFIVLSFTNISSAMRIEFVSILCYRIET